MSNLLYPVIGGAVGAGIGVGLGAAYRRDIIELGNKRTAEQNAELSTAEGIGGAIGAVVGIGGTLLYNYIVNNYRRRTRNARMWNRTTSRQSAIRDLTGPDRMLRPFNMRYVSPPPLSSRQQEDIHQQGMWPHEMRTLRETQRLQAIARQERQEAARIQRAEREEAARIKRAELERAAAEQRERDLAEAEMYNRPAYSAGTRSGGAMNNVGQTAGALNSTDWNALGSVDIGGCPIQ